MSKVRVVPLMVAFLVGCGGSSSLTGDPGSSDPGTQLECYGEPDSGGVICKPASELWDCSSMPNGDVKCRKTGFTTPEGTADWNCTVANGTVVCTTAATNVPGGTSGGTGGTGDTGGTSGGSGDTGGTWSVPGGSGWTCVSDGTTVTCTYSGGSSVPPGGGSWNCSVTEFGLICVGQPGSSGPGSTSTGGTGGTGDTSGTGGTGDTSGTGDTGDTSGTGGTTTWSGFACSYAMFVFTYQGKIYVMKIANGAVTCVGENTTSKDDNFNYSCNGTAYDNNGFVFNMDGSPVAPFPGNCPANFSFSKDGVVAGPGITILFGVAHNGSFPNHFAELCPPAGGATSMSFPPICGGN